MDKTLVEIDGLRLDYGAVCAVKDVSFHMKAGEILAVIGPNGSGKTSTVECVEGLRRPTSGSVQVFGVNPLNNRSQVYREMGIQLQEAEYPDKIKVKELCGLFASFYENPADWHLLLKQLGLEEKAGRTVKKLSGGEKQRLSVLLALLPRPRLLILDELTTGLDPEIRHGLWESLRRIKEAGCGILLVSHYLDEVEALADRLLYLVNGQQEFLGTQEEFRAYVKRKTQGEGWREDMSLEKMYLLISPKTNVVTMEGIL